ncbi:MAG: hypothetical protein KGI68_03400 [Alphaproteobacteria bacterium]|nr:hypothetical protein [Alphaproteobacteria bacterium]MDE1985399.1 hypothetical protein [Alphaproteobacteria bacterium]MDE2161974.1 hypothetical protein [Alphaproteobacteria bacterium]MDE2267101.1 hypothetical protein [Alphaproteobacteria bacterium]MDE2499499.1 hypothetical protein [Alphaproteobacteria bacterium]
MSRTADDDETIRKRSGWLIPLGVFFITFVLSAMFLLLYLAPSAPSLFEEQISPTSRSDIIALKVRNLALYIPANYLEYQKTRQGGTRHEIALFAMLPDMTGWSNWEAQTFAGNGAKSPVVYMLIHEDNFDLSETERLRRVYMDYVTDKRGAPGPYGLTQYTFREDSGYQDEDLYVGHALKGPIVLRCVRFGPQVPSPNCLRDLSVGKGVSLSYRFKRAHLSQWREIADGVDKLVTSFEKPPK